MAPAPTFLCLLSVLISLCSALTFDKRGFEFVQREYARAITENHAINKAVMHIRATGCSGNVVYTINPTNTPFMIDSKGHVMLVEPLNYTVAQRYDLEVTAVGGKGKCVATTQVHFEILSANRRAPQFELERYTCDIIENTRELRITPPMRVLDSDKGDAGQVKKVTVVESDLPFIFTVDSEGYVTGKATKDVDAEDIEDYFFDIIAWDGGNPPKSSYPISLECEVDDVNEFVPKFDQDYYEAKIGHGITYDKIIQVSAKDEDIGLVNGHICKYIIQGIDLPFKISKSGVISLDEPLGPDAYDQYEFQVDAVDCGGMMSVKSTTVSITVEDPCHEEFIGPSKHELTLQQCTGKVNIIPDLTLNECARKATKANFSALVHLETDAGMGCDRDTYEASDLFELCGASGFIDLLPKAGNGREWTKTLEMASMDTDSDENSHFFNGKTVMRIPAGVVPEDVGDAFTISTWIKMGWSKSRQVIVANTDKERLDRIHFSLYTMSNYLVFVHRRDPIHADRDVYCNAEYKYKPNIFDAKWHHVVAVANGCGVKLYVDGEHQTPFVSEANWPLHNSQLEGVLTVGAHWHGKEKMYNDFFTGSLSGLVIRPNSTTNEQVLSCMVGCKEHVNVDGPLPEHFFAKTLDFANIKITGEGSATDFETALQKVVYINERMIPTPGKRSITILSEFNNAVPLATVAVDVVVAGNTRPVIIVRGCKDIAAKKDFLKETGVPLCKSFEIEYDSCEGEEETPVNRVHYLDSLTVKVNPPFQKGESFNFPKDISGETRLKESGLTMSYNNEELVIRGIAHFSEYEEILREMVYVNFVPDDMLHREFTISVSTLNGKCVSDQEQLHLTILHEENRMNNYGIRAAKVEQQGEQMPGIVSLEGGFGVASSNSLSAGIMAVIIICSLSIFIFLIVLGIYKFRQRPDTVKVVPPGDEKEEMYWDDTGLSGVRITLNPMQKFQELDLNEDGNNTERSDSEDEEGKATKGLLEWDNSDI